MGSRAHLFFGKTKMARYEEPPLRKHYYNDYYAKSTFNREEKVFFGMVLNSSDTITFQSQTAEKLDAAFHDAVKAYEEQCKIKKREPRMLRME